MKFTEALSKLGMGQVLGMEGTDWSWYWYWKVDSYHESVMLVDQSDKPRPVVYCDYETDDFVIIDKVDLPKGKSNV